MPSINMPTGASLFRCKMLAAVVALKGEGDPPPLAGWQ
jgi:hypothetical protein